MPPDIQAWLSSWGCEQLDSLLPGDAYAGIGSRKAGPIVLARIQRLAAVLAARGVVCRSGGADGCDTAFEMGAKGEAGPFEGYAPWKGFNGRDWDVTIPAGAAALVRQFHPKAGSLKSSVVRLMERNCQQVLGRNLDSPAKLIVCWTPDGADGVCLPTTQATGGTGMAIRLGSARGIRVVNLCAHTMNEA